MRAIPAHVVRSRTADVLHESPSGRKSKMKGKERMILLVLVVVTAPISRREVRSVG